MKIQYEIGDAVWCELPEPTTVVAVRKNGVTVETVEGERFFFSKKKVQPTATTCEKAKWLQS